MNLRERGGLVDDTGSAIFHGGHSLSMVPGLLARLLREQAWRAFVTQMGEEVHHERFEAFVTEPPLKGLGTTLSMLKRLVSDDPATLDLLDQALQRPHGGDQRSEAAQAAREASSASFERNNVTLDTPLRGNTDTYALRRLRAHAPELHARVMARELSPHAAMVVAGFRRRTLSVPIDDMTRLAALLCRHLDAAHRDELRRLLDADRAEEERP